MTARPVPRLIGMVHLPALPGAPAYAGDIDRVLERARRDALTLTEAGFDAIMVENFGDVPFYADRVPPETVAAMTRAVTAVTEVTPRPVGVNVLRNDARAAVAIAAATGAAMIRVNVLAGTMFTDQGTIEGQAATVVRERARLAPDVVIAADVLVKHATPPPGLDLTTAAKDLVERAGADAVIVSGRATGSATSLDDIQTVRGAIGPRPLLVGSGVTVDTVRNFLEVADGVIVGSGIKRGGDTTQPIDPILAEAFVAEATA